MSLKSFGRGRDGDDDLGARAAAPPAAPGGLTAFIDQGSEFEGKLSFRDTVRIDGRFRGEIASENTLIVGETGEIEATIRSNTVAISGSVEGDVHAARKVVLHKTARVTGNVTTPCLVVEEGAVDQRHVQDGDVGRQGPRIAQGDRRRRAARAAEAGAAAQARRRGHSATRSSPARCELRSEPQTASQR